MVEAISWNYGIVSQKYKHSFLIRDPFKMYSSYEKLSGKSVPIDFRVTFKNIYHELEAFYNHVVTALGQSAPPIIDADDLLQQPDKILPKYCDAMGIPYTPGMLSWESISDATELNWECTDVGPIAVRKNFPALITAFSSTGFLGGEAEHEFSEDVRECATHAMPVYKRLYELRIKP